MDQDAADLADRHGHLLRLLLDLTETDQPGEPDAPHLTACPTAGCGALVSQADAEGVAATCPWYACWAKGRRVFPGDLPRVVRVETRKPASGPGGRSPG